MYIFDLIFAILVYEIICFIKSRKKYSLFSFNSLECMVYACMGMGVHSDLDGSKPLSASC